MRFGSPCSSLTMRPPQRGYTVALLTLSRRTEMNGKQGRLAAVYTRSEWRREHVPRPEPESIAAPTRTAAEQRCTSDAHCAQ